MLPSRWLAVVGLILCCVVSSVGFTARENHYPNHLWWTSTPEEQGMDSAKLAEMFQFIKDDDLQIRSVLVIRHGYLVAEAYRNPYNKDTAVNVKSVTKSFLSTLTGIALREKYFQGVDQKVAELLPEYFAADADPVKREITLKHLLTMNSGLQFDNDNQLGQWVSDQDWGQYTIDQPLNAKPGTLFNYSDGLPHLMSRIITKTSGMSTLQFARKYLFDPLGINVKKWDRDPQGFYIGGCELSLTPRDMAKLGYLYLHHGVWDGKQIVPEAWIEESVKAYVAFNDYSGYGYWWWVTKDDYYASGWGGQIIAVNPKLDTVVVFTAADPNKPYQFLRQFVYPAVKTEQSLCPNPVGVHNMQKAIAALSASMPEPNLSSQPTVSLINNKTFDCPAGIGLKSFSLSFEGRRCIAKYQIDQIGSQFPVGLEGAYIVTPVRGPVVYFGIGVDGLPINRPGNETYEVAFRGKWLEQNVFLLEWLNYTEDPVKYAAKLTFNGKKVVVEMNRVPTDDGNPMTFVAECRE